VRQSARRSTFTGTTYNSLENISQFFSDRGLPFKPGQPAAQQRPDLKTPPVLPRPVGSPSKPLTVAPPPARRGMRAGMVVEHPKYGAGTVVRREGEGEDAKITVNFPRYGLKKLVEKFAGLKKS
jgi:DNA helicase-2/ATP-dependent DNA helicase PcrA